MKKTLLSIFILFSLFFVVESAYAWRYLCTSEVGGKYATCNADGTCCGGKGGNENSGWVEKIDGKSYCANYSAPPAPVELKEEMPNPAPVPALSYGSEYSFAKYLSFLPDSFTVPVNDPVTIPGQDQSLLSYYLQYAEPVTIDQIYKTLFMPFADIEGLEPIYWPPESAYDYTNLWGTLYSYTFKPESGSNWYPLNFMSIPDPTSKFHLNPTPVEIKWSAVPGAFNYNFKLEKIGDAVQADSTTTPVDIVTPNTSYSLNGYGGAAYYWSVAPLDSNGVEIQGPSIIDYGTFNPFYFSPNPAVSANGCTAGQRCFKYGPAGSAPGKLYIEWSPIPGATRYEFQYAERPIPDDLPFQDGATFNRTAYPPDYHIFQNVPLTTTHVLSSCSNCNLGVGDNLSNDPDVFQADLGTISLNTAQPVYWRVRGCVNATGGVCDPVQASLVQNGVAEIPLPKTPYESGYFSWARVSGATSYIIDVVEKVVDFNRLPRLSQFDPLPVPVNGGQSASVFSAQVAEAQATTMPFLIRRVVADRIYDSGEITALKFKSLLDNVRVYLGDVYYAQGLVDAEADFGSGDLLGTTFSEAKAATDNFTNFNKPVVSGSSDTVRDRYWPRIAGHYDDFGVLQPYILGQITVQTSAEDSTLANNQLKLISGYFLDISDNSTGKSKINIAASSDKKTYILTFTSKTGGGTTGSYSLKITYPVQSDFVYPLSVPEIGPVPFIGDLSNRAYAEFKNLLPGTTYYWRVRAICENSLSGSPCSSNTNPFTWGSWSQVGTFMTPTGIPVKAIFKSFEKAQADAMVISTKEPESPSGILGGVTRITTSIKNFFSKFFGTKNSSQKDF